MVNFKEDENLKTLNHSCAHLMAQAVKQLYPDAKFWVGPVVAEGFYYDIDLGDRVIRDEDIAAIEKEMKKVAKTGKKIIRREISKQEAMELFKDDEYKIDLISKLEDGTITCYDQGDFTDLCRGPHCREFMVYVFLQQRNLRLILHFLRKQKSVTTEKSVRICSFSCLMTLLDAVFRCSFQRVM